MNKNNTRSVIRFLAGGYLTYLAFGLFSDVRTEEFDTTMTLIFGGFALLFAVVGFLLMFSVVRAELRRRKEGRQQEEAPDDPAENNTTESDEE